MLFSSVSLARHSEFDDSPPLNHGDDLESRITNAPVDTQVNEPENYPGDVGDDYAKITFSTFVPSEDEETNQHTGIVNAFSECEKEPIYLEPVMDHDHTIAPTKIGPLGDIYTMPDAKNHAVTSPGNISGGSDSHPITEQEVVYAVPMKKSRSPAANQPSEFVYENLHSEMLDKEQAAEEDVQTE